LRQSFTLSSCCILPSCCILLFERACRDDAKAQALLLQAAVEEGWPEAMDVLGNAYAAGGFGFEVSLAKALPLYEHAAHLNMHSAMVKVAQTYK
jgi:TPR repeat protein